MYLAAADAGGNLTGYRTGERFGAAENGVSVGRYTNSTGVEFVALSQRTLGVDNPGTLAQFRSGGGLPNAYPKVGPVVLNELMYEPVTVVGGQLVENPEEEFVELYNISTNGVPLFDPNYPTNVWQLKGGVEYEFPTGTVMGGQSYLLVVGFDPVGDPAALAAFRARYGVGGATMILGPFEGRLSDEGESIELYKPDAPSPAPEAGLVPRILVDRVVYGVGAPWAEAAGGGGASLQRRSSSAFGNDPLNWKAEPPTPGLTNLPAAEIPPVITTQPRGQNVMVGSTVTCNVAAVGTWPLSYQWRLNGADLPGATNATLTISNAQQANSGSYQVWISNSAGLICSQPAVVAVSTPPIIILQPLSTSVAVGGVATLQVTAGGTKPLVYQWYFNNWPVPAAADASLVLAGVNWSAAGVYRVVVSNAAGVAVSYPAMLKVIGTDSDGDGIPDSWLVEQFGHPTGSAADHSRAGDDADTDGLSNFQEYLAGTDPHDPMSCLILRMQGMDPGTGRPLMSFTTVAGFDYTIQYCDSLGSGVWYRLIDVPSDPVTRVVMVGDPGTASTSGRFYRVVTPIQASLDLDTDGDGLPDSWLLEHFGHATALASDRSRAQDDADNDGMSNLGEYLSGTDPLDTNSSLKLHVLTRSPWTGRPEISFTAMPDKGYTVQYSTTAALGIWHKLSDVPTEASVRMITLDDPGALSAAIRFYRVITPIQP